MGEKAISDVLEDLILQHAPELYDDPSKTEFIGKLLDLLHKRYSDGWRNAWEAVKQQAYTATATLEELRENPVYTPTIGQSEQDMTVSIAKAQKRLDKKRDEYNKLMDMDGVDDRRDDSAKHEIEHD